jgi:competence ComEA-like helix-hairpin-helix protein
MKPIRKPLTERWQSIFGITKSELSAALLLLAITSAALLYRWIFNPSDPLHDKLSAEIQQALDSVNKEAGRHQNAVTRADSLRYRYDTINVVNTVTSKILRYQTKIKPGQIINLNTATLDELRMLPGIGSRFAERILAARNNKKFKSVDDLSVIPGIGKKKIDGFRPYVKVE